MASSIVLKKNNFNRQLHHNIDRSSHSQLFFKTGALKSFPNFTAKHLYWGLVLIKLQAWGLQRYQKKAPTQVLSCEIYEIFKNIFFNRTPPAAASVLKNNDFAFNIRIVRLTFTTFAPLRGSHQKRSIKKVEHAAWFQQILQASFYLISSFGDASRLNNYGFNLLGSLSKNNSPTSSLSIKLWSFTIDLSSDIFIDIYFWPVVHFCFAKGLPFKLYYVTHLGSS